MNKNLDIFRCAFAKKGIRAISFELPKREFIASLLNVVKEYLLCI